MPGVPHETMVFLLREHPEWLRALVAILAGRELPPALKPIDANVRVVDPAEVRLDLAFVSDENNGWVFVEVQLDEDHDKAHKWPLAVAALWNERTVPGDLVVITPDRAVATWARTVCMMSGPLGTRLGLQPVVVQLTGDVADLLLDPTHPELAFFAAWTVHDRYGPEAQSIVERATTLIGSIADPSLRASLIRHILGMLHDKLLQRIAEVSTMAEYKIPTNPALMRIGDELWGDYGAKQKAKGRAEALLTVLAARGLEINAARQTEVLECQETARLDQWIKNAVRAATVDEVFTD